MTLLEFLRDELKLTGTKRGCDKGECGCCTVHVNGETTLSCLLLAADVEGGGKFVNRADDFIVLHRYIQHPSDWMKSHIHVRKIKEIETGGRPTPMEEPIVLKSMIGNVGFEINGVPVLEKPIKEEIRQVISIE